VEFLEPVDEPPGAVDEVVPVVAVLWLEERTEGLLLVLRQNTREEGLGIGVLFTAVLAADPPGARVGRKSGALGVGQRGLGKGVVCGHQNPST